MPQLDRYLVFSEIFWFALLFTISYLAVYYLLVMLSKGLRLRSALESHHLVQTLQLKSEKNALASLANLILEQQILELGRLTRWFSLSKRLVHGVSFFAHPAVTNLNAELPTSASLTAARLILLVGESQDSGVLDDIQELSSTRTAEEKHEN